MSGASDENKVSAARRRRRPLQEASNVARLRSHRRAARRGWDESRSSRERFRPVCAAARMRAGLNPSPRGPERATERETQSGGDGSRESQSATLKSRFLHLFIPFKIAQMLPHHPTLKKTKKKNNKYVALRVTVATELGVRHLNCKCKRKTTVEPVGCVHTSKRSRVRQQASILQESCFYLQKGATFTSMRAKNKELLDDCQVTFGKTRSILKEPV